MRSVSAVVTAALAMLSGIAHMASSSAANVAGTPPFYTNTFEKIASAAAMNEIGRALFFDRALSATGKMACATCHDPTRAFGPSNDSPVQRGGADGGSTGVRAVPSLMYTQNVPSFTQHYSDDDGDDSIDQGPAGGRMWDGRAQSAHEQARLPLFSSLEMANASVDSVVGKVRRAQYAAQFRATFGEKIFEDPQLAFKAVLMALETFQQSSSEFYPYTSKYDAWLRGHSELSPQEARGLAAFNDASKGNCARCHPSAKRHGALPQFTDFGYAAIGAPRNREIPANAEPRYYDLGLCGPLRTDLADKKAYCGLFRTPSLRNVALRPVFFHNGVVHRLEDAVRFYAERDAQPQKWYSRGLDGVTVKFDDLPIRYRDNIDFQPPFNRQPEGRAALGEGEVRDIVAFLQTLTDGYAQSPE